MLRIPVERSVFPLVKAYGKMSKPGVIRVPQAASIRRQQSITHPKMRLKLKIRRQQSITHPKIRLKLKSALLPDGKNPLKF